MALDFLAQLFGGSTQQQTSVSVPKDLQAPEFKDLRGPLAGTLMKTLETGGPQYTGPLNAPITPVEVQNLADLNTMVGPDTSRNALIESTLGGNFLPGQPGSNPFLQAAIEAAQRPTLQGLEETLSRSLPGRFTAAGQFVQPQGSSAFDRAAALATRSVADAIGDIATKMGFAGYESERGRQQEAVGLSREEVGATINNLQAQALPRLIQELGIERGLAVFQQQSAQLLQILQTLAGVTAPVVANKTTSQATGEAARGIVPGLTGLFSGGSSGSKPAA